MPAAAKLDSESSTKAIEMANAKALKETATQKVLQESQQVLEDQLSA